MGEITGSRAMGNGQRGSMGHDNNSGNGHGQGQGQGQGMYSNVRGGGPSQQGKNSGFGYIREEWQLN